MRDYELGDNTPIGIARQIRVGPAPEISKAGTSSLGAETEVVCGFAKSELNGSERVDQGALLLRRAV
jgi:hypothetical protein